MIRTLTILTIAALWAAPAASAAGVDPIYTGYFSSVAIDGYDPVGYYREGEPVPGSSQNAYEWRGATWYFSSAENRARFEKEPERYAPQYGGYCAYAVANGTTAPGDPQLWKIVDDKLYLNVSKSIQAEWEKDVAGYVVRADAAWPRLLGGP